MSRKPNDAVAAAVCRSKDRLTRQQAHTIARRMTRKHSRPVRPYACSICGSWHVGSPLARAA